MWHSGRIGNMPEVRLACSGKLAVERAKDRMENMVVRGPLHGVINFSGC
jgi:hypothetical protein